MTRQAMQLGWLPGLTIRQTSDQVYGQIYVPVVNWLLMVASVSTTIAFGSSDRLASAYGTAVATTMLLTTVLLYQAMAGIWRWPRSLAVLTGGLFFIVDLAFFSANLLKIEDGGWLPLSLAAIIFVVMTTWRKGTEAIQTELTQTPEEAARFLSKLKSGAIPRVEGTTVFITRSNQRVSRLIVDHARYTGVLPLRTVALSIRFETTPRIAEPKCTVVEQLADGLWLIVARFGFFEIPDSAGRAEQRPRTRSAHRFDRARFVAARDLVVRKVAGRHSPPGASVCSRFVSQCREDRQPIQPAAAAGGRDRAANRDLEVLIALGAPIHQRPEVARDISRSTLARQSSIPKCADGRADRAKCISRHPSGLTSARCQRHLRDGVPPGAAWRPWFWHSWFSR